MRPTLRQLARAVRLVAAAVGAPTATYCFDGRFALPLGDGWTLTISPDDAGRLRLGACFGNLPVATMWCLADDESRLRDLALGLATEIKALA